MNYNRTTIKAANLRPDDKIIIGNQAFNIRKLSKDSIHQHIYFHPIIDGASDSYMRFDYDADVNIERLDFDEALVATLDRAITRAQTQQSVDLINSMLFNFFELNDSTEDLNSEYARGQLEMLIYTLNNDHDELIDIDDRAPIAQYFYYRGNRLSQETLNV